MIVDIYLVVNKVDIHDDGCGLGGCTAPSPHRLPSSQRDGCTAWTSPDYGTLSYHGPALVTSAPAILISGIRFGKIILFR
jgi:hypothetical protein